MRGVLLLAITIVLSRPIDARGRRHDYPGNHEYPKKGRGVNLADITPESQNNTEVVAQLGGTASIKCYTHFIGDETVTWLKRDEDQLLTAGGQVYSSESRYSVSHVRHQQLWELSVRDVKMSDAGMYECQLTTHPPTSLFFILKVVEARAVLQGGPDMHVQTGATLRLHCVLHHATENPEFIFWYHNNSMINYAPRRPLKVLEHRYSSVLIISNVRWDDAGSYRCEPHMARPANLTLHVVAGEKHAALHNGQGDGDEHSAASTSTTSISASASTLLATSCLAVIILHHFYAGTVSDSTCDLTNSSKTDHRQEDGEEQEKEEGMEKEKEGGEKATVFFPLPQEKNSGNGAGRSIMKMGVVGKQDVEKKDYYARRCS